MKKRASESPSCTSVGRLADQSRDSCSGGWNSRLAWVACLAVGLLGACRCDQRDLSRLRFACTTTAECRDGNVCVGGVCVSAFGGGGGGSIGGSGGAGSLGGASGGSSQGGAAGGAGGGTSGGGGGGTNGGTTGGSMGGTTGGAAGGTTGGSTGGTTGGTTGGAAGGTTGGSTGGWVGGATGGAQGTTGGSAGVSGGSSGGTTGARGGTAGGGTGGAQGGTGGGSTGGGNTYYVATSGSDVNTCLQARSMATPKATISGPDGGLLCLTTPGDQLLIRGGAYDEVLSNTVGTTRLRSGVSWDAGFAVRANPGDGPVIIRQIVITTDTTPDVCVAHTRSSFGFWTYEGLNVVNTTGDQAVFLACPDHLRFRNMDVTTGGSPGSCVMIGGASFLEFSDVEVHHCGDRSRCDAGCAESQGISFAADDVLLDRVRVHDTTGYGVLIYGSACDEVSAPCPDRAVVRNSDVWNTGNSGSTAAILVTYGDNTLVYNNVLRDSDYGVVVSFGASRTRVYNNTIVANRAHGISVESNFGSRGVFGTVVENNLVTNNGEWGVSNSSTGSPWGEPAGSVIRNNLGFGNVRGTLFDTGSGSVTSGNFDADPWFANLSGRDLHILDGGPGIDRGIDQTAQGLANDHDGNPRPLGPLFDIGAFEGVVPGVRRGRGP